MSRFYDIEAEDAMWFRTSNTWADVTAICSL